MFSFLWKVFLHQPLYNALVFLISVVPGHDLGIAVILLTLLVKIILIPLSKKMINDQILMKKIEPRLQEIKEKYKNNKEELSRKTLEIYREFKINPLSSVFTMVIQICVVIALYFIITKSINEKETILYPFISYPDSVKIMFLGFVDLAAKSLPIAILVGIGQFVQAELTIDKPKKVENQGKEVSFKDDFARSMDIQIRYVLPIFIAFIASALPSLVGLYWLTSSVFTTIQTIYLKKHLNKKHL